MNFEIYIHSVIHLCSDLKMLLTKYRNYKGSLLGKCVLFKISGYDAANRETSQSLHPKFSADVGQKRFGPVLSPWRI